MRGPVPSELWKRDVHTACFGRMMHELQKPGVPIIAFQEGGYIDDAQPETTTSLVECVASFIMAFCSGQGSGQGNGLSNTISANAPANGAANGPVNDSSNRMNILPFRLKHCQYTSMCIMGSTVKNLAHVTASPK